MAERVHTGAAKPGHLKVTIKLISAVLCGPSKCSLGKRQVKGKAIEFGEFCLLNHRHIPSWRAAVGASEHHSPWAGRGDKERAKPWKPADASIPAGAGDHSSRTVWGDSFGLCATADTTPPTTVCHLASIRTHPNAHMQFKIIPPNSFLFSQLKHKKAEFTWKPKSQYFFVFFSNVFYNDVCFFSFTFLIFLSTKHFPTDTG